MRTLKLYLFAILTLIFLSQNIFSQTDSTTNNFPKIEITDIQLSGNSLLKNASAETLNEIKQGKLTLKGKTNDITIFWDIPIEQNMNDIEFSHILEGYDKEWGVGKDKFTKYSDLEPGLYRLIIKIGNDKIEDNKNTTSLQIKILPKIYQTLLFKLLSFLIIIVLIPVVIIVIVIKRKRTKK